MLTSPLSSLRGVGPALNKLLCSLLGGDKVFNLLLHKPVRAEKILFCPRLFEAPKDELIIIKAKVEKHTKPATPRQPYKVICYNPTGYVTLVFFKIFPTQIAKMKIDSEIAILGNLQRLAGENQIVHPQEIIDAKEIEKLPKLNVVYPLTAGLSQKFIARIISEIAAKIDENYCNWLDENLRLKQGWETFKNAIKTLHYLKEGNVELARKRLAYDELLAWQIAVLLAKNRIEKNKKFSVATKNLTKDFLAQLPFRPTAAQLKAMSEIKEEIFSSKKMLRLLQGDVGSGKTVVAIAACLETISQKKQSCVIAPTTVLAKQHFSYFKKFLDKFDITIEILTSATTKKQKENILEKLCSGKIDILIGTHAILEDNVRFRKLGLAVIDEQHRFGVMQRLKLVEKNEDVDLLLMSATPIPRSLMMGLYGDMDISILGEKPKNRQEIETLVMSAQKTDEIHEAIKRAVLRGEKIYWICPEIDIKTPDKITIDSPTKKSVEEKFLELEKIFGKENLGLLHGRMNEKQKEKVMNDFAFGPLKILVATTVIEVGIDVPDATIILIENAESFGLSQLHQLRGRVGRSDKKSFCILLYGEKFGAGGRKRLNILRQSNDGFFIAEEDLKMRGSGELLGTKQSGFPEFRIADLNYDSDLLKIAHKNAALVLNLAKHEDDKFILERKFSNLLELFNYDDCFKIITGG